MFKRRTVFALIASLGVGTIASGHPEASGPLSNQNGGWALKSWLKSRHETAHNTVTNGQDEMVVLFKRKPLGAQLTQIKGVFETPFVDVIATSGGALAAAREPWYRHATDGRGKYKVYANGNYVGGAGTFVSHTYAKKQAAAVTRIPAEEKGMVDWNGGGGPPSAFVDVFEGGQLQLDANGDITEDENGDIIWIVPPQPSYRFTSSVSYNGNGIVTYTYTLESFVSNSRTFAIPEVTTVQYPTGWSGTLPAFGTVATSVTDTASDDVYSQHAAFQILDPSTPLYEQVRTALIYVPTSRLTTDIEVDILSATNDSLTGDNVVHFEVTDGADGAVLYRENNGDLELVAEIASPLAIGMTYEFRDSDPAGGTNTYHVVAGTGVNGAASDGAAVVN